MIPAVQTRLAAETTTQSDMLPIISLLRWMSLDPPEIMVCMDVSFVRVQATVGSKFEFESPNDFVGYYQRLGVTAPDRAALLKEIQIFVFNDTGGTVLEMDDYSVPDFEGADRDIWDVCEGTNRIGVWYVSGRAYYGKEDGE